MGRKSGLSVCDGATVVLSLSAATEGNDFRQAPIYGQEREGGGGELLFTLIQTADGKGGGGREGGINER